MGRTSTSVFCGNANLAEAQHTQSENMSKQTEQALMGNSPPVAQIAYFTTISFERSLKEAFLGGGIRHKIALKAKAILGSLGQPNPFDGFPLTHHGEKRIPNCLKYDLGNGWRLVTQQANKACLFLFIGDHDDVDHWLNTHKGATFGIRDGIPIIAPGSADSLERIGPFQPDQHGKPLAERIDSERIDFVLDGLPRSIAKQLEALDGRANSDDLMNIISQISDAGKSELVRVVFSLISRGDYAGARTHVDFRKSLIKPIEEVKDDELVSVTDGEEVRRIRIGSIEYEKWLNDFERNSPWYEWFLFLHPEQKKVVEKNYSETAQLSGVSGSGKTCVVVRRALRLAAAPDAKVLLLTLNRSLSGLLRQLVEASCSDRIVRDRIHVSSFFELAQKLLFEFEPQNINIYTDVTWKLNEHVDEVFREYYRGWTNNNDANILFMLHQSLIANGISGEAYVRDEFDWIRSAVGPDNRRKYLSLDRKGRKYPITDERRAELLKGLECWEKKMRDVGVVDYLGLTSALSKYIARLKPLFTNVLVDEAQDFGTTELAIIRQLVPFGSNDVFLCGDIAQTVLPKHRSLSEAGFRTIARETIRQNYRNSREILNAAYDVLKNNLHDAIVESDDLEILDPKFANFSGAVPMALSAETLEQEIAYARGYAATRLKQGAKSVCLAFAGFSSRDINGFAAKCGVTALDGAYDPSSDSLVFCDLEQTKGYEFDTLIVIQCRDGVLPPHDAPMEEAYRASCKLYVAMTRAKKELILSFHDKVSPWISAVTSSIGVALWSEFEHLDNSLLKGVPEILPEYEIRLGVEAAGKLTGVEFVYTAYAVGLSLEAQGKLIELVDGRGLRSASGGSQLKWPNVQSLLDDINASRRHDQRIGPKVAAELRQLSLSR